MNLVSPQNAALYSKSTEVPQDELAQVVKLYPDLIKLMTKHKGCGLAANQVGITKRFFVWHHGMVINPKILERSEKGSEATEGCLSFPGQTKSVWRHNSIKVEYLDEHLNLKQKDLSGLAARIFQHEYAHLEGRCIV